MNKAVIPSDYIKSSVMTPLQERAAKLGVCANCHKKRLNLFYIGGGIDWYQCGKCLYVYALPEQPKLLD